VKLTPRAADPGTTPAVGIMTLDKQFHGPLEARSEGEMLASRVESTGAAVYVALERVTGTLAGRTGTFVLAHTGTMTKEGQQLTIIVAPGSGTGALAGIGGTMNIRIEGTAHFYDFDYTLP
jgi:Protein of unknown function (DUF3224)